MFFDSLEQAKLHFQGNQAFASAFAAIENYATKPFQPGRWELDGENMYIVAAEYTTSPLSDASQLEAHRKYIDIMYMLEGEECIYCQPINQIGHITSPFNEEKDFLLANVEGEVFPNALREGQVAVLLREDAHCPGCHLQGEKLIRKLICKLAYKAAMDN